MLGHSYGLRKISSIVEDFNNIKNIKIEIVPTKNHNIGLYSTGCRLFFPNSTYSLSVQTDSLVAGDSFCETALLLNDDIIYDGSLGYDDVIRHYEIEDLKKHLEEIYNSINHENTEV